MVACLVSTTPAVAAGSSSEDPPVRRSDAGITQAVTLIERQDYAGALTALEGVVDRNPRNADAYNLMGYASRKQGAFDAAFSYYQQALDIDPRHLGALQYLGELYLDLGDIPGAQAQLERIDSICWLGCEEERDLAAQIQAALNS